MLFTWVALSGLWVALSGCGDDSDGAGVPDDKVLSTLSDSELGSVCDYLARETGGYGATRTCGTETRKSWPDQAACKSSLAPLQVGCGATFGQLRACSAKQAAAGCDTAAAENSPECKAFDDAC